MSNTLTSIGRCAFLGCTGLTSIKLPNSLESISIGAFEGCSGLTNIIIPNSVKSIGNDSFYGTHISEIHIPSSVTEIGSLSFYDTPLEKVIIGSGLKQFKTAFDAKTIKSIIIFSNNMICSTPFENMDKSSASIYVPDPVNSLKMLDDVYRNRFVNVMDISPLTTDYNGKVPEFKYNVNVPGLTAKKSFVWVQVLCRKVTWSKKDTRSLDGARFLRQCQLVML